MIRHVPVPPVFRVRRFAAAPAAAAILFFSIAAAAAAPPPLDVVVRPLSGPPGLRTVVLGATPAVVSASNAPLEALFPDGGLLCLTPGTSVALSSVPGPDGGTVLLSVLKGFFRFAPGVGFHPPYAISTPAGTIDPGPSEVSCTIGSSAGCLALGRGASLKSGGGVVELPQDEFRALAFSPSSAYAGSGPGPLPADLRADFDRGSRTLDEDGCVFGRSYPPNDLVNSDTMLGASPTASVSPTQP